MDAERTLLLPDGYRSGFAQALHADDPAELNKHLEACIGLKRDRLISKEGGKIPVKHESTPWPEEDAKNSQIKAIDNIFYKLIRHAIGGRVSGFMLYGDNNKPVCHSTSTKLPSLVLPIAARFGSLKIVSSLLASNSKYASEVDPAFDGQLAFRWACKYKHVAIVELLLNDKRVEALKYFNTVLGKASKNGDVEIVNVLLIRIGSDAVAYAAQVEADKIAAKAKVDSDDDYGGKFPR
jgi:hypothetical protein